MGALLFIVYVISLLITAGGAIYVLRTELAEDRRRLECSWQSYQLEVTWLNVILGVFLVFLPIMNSIIAVVILGSLLDRPVLSKRKKS